MITVELRLIAAVVKFLRRMKISREHGTHCDIVEKCNFYNVGTEYRINVIARFHFSSNGISMDKDNAKRLRKIVAGKTIVFLRIRKL